MLSAIRFWGGPSPSGFEAPHVVAQERLEIAELFFDTVLAAVPHHDCFVSIVLQPPVAAAK